jgi:hypothetical protein
MGGMMIDRGKEDNPRNTCSSDILSAKIPLNLLGLIPACDGLRFKMASS